MQGAPQRRYPSLQHHWAQLQVGQRREVIVTLEGEAMAVVRYHDPHLMLVYGKFYVYDRGMRVARGIH
jgi:hypothetical protein